MAAVIANDVNDLAVETQSELDDSKDDPKASTDELKRSGDNEIEKDDECVKKNDGSFCDKKDEKEIIVAENVENTEVANISKDNNKFEAPAATAQKRHISNHEPQPSTKKTKVIFSWCHKKRSERINSDDSDEDYDFGGPNPFGGMDEMGNWHEPGSPY